MKGWQAFLNDAPARVTEVIETGPIPLQSYDGKVTFLDKKRGMIKFKGVGGRGARSGKGAKTQTKSGKMAVVYFDPNFCQGEYIPVAVPDEVMERHTRDKVVEAFKQL